MFNRTVRTLPPPQELFDVQKVKSGKRTDSLYLQFYRQLKEAILNGKIGNKESTRLWSPRLLHETLGISRNTAIQAYDKLYKDGLIERKPWKGYFTLSANRSKLSQRGRRIAMIGKKVDGVPSRPIPFSTSLPDVCDKETLSLWRRLGIANFKATMEPVHSPEDRRNKREFLGYAHPAGLEQLRIHIADYLKKVRNVECDYDQIILTSGAQQAFDIIAKMTLDDGDSVMIEEPTYFGARYALEAAGAKITPIPVDSGGFDVKAAIAADCNPRLIYTTPFCQFPTGTVMPSDRREALLKYVHSHNLLLIEDDHAPFLYIGNLNDSLQKLERKLYGDQRVLFVGSFTKIFFPGLRFGFIVVPKDMKDEFLSAKILMDLHHTTLGQGTINLQLKHIEKHIKKMERIYKDRQKTLVKEIENKLGDFLYFERTEYLKNNLEGGDSNLVVESGTEFVVYVKESIIKKGFIDQKFAEYAISTDHGEGKRVRIRPLSTFYIDKSAIRQGFVLGFSGFEEDEIKEGVKNLAEHFDNYI